MTRRLAIAAGLGVVGWSGLAGAQVAPAAPERLAVGDWLFAPVVEARVRGEVRRDLDEETHGLFVERARLGLDALRGPLEARVVFQDARALDAIQSASAADAVVGPGSSSVTGAYEAWVDAHTDSARPSFVRVGRQPIAWGEGRLLGTADWSPTGRSLDAVRGRLVTGDVALEVLAAVLTDPQTSASLDAYGELLGARFEWAFDPLFTVDAYALVRVAQSDPLEGSGSAVGSRTSGVGSAGGAIGDAPRGETYTASLRLHGDAHAWTWGAEGAYQVGRAEDLGENRAAWAAAAHVAYTFEAATLRPAIRVGAAYASGASGNARTDRTFDPLLPDVHTWHGAMDLFAWSNEEEASARLAITPWTDGLAVVEYRYAQLARPDGIWRTAYLTPIGSAPGNTKASLGHEIDATVRWSPWEPVTLEAGYGLFVLGDGARAVLAANAVGRLGTGGDLSTASPSHFAYAQATLAIP